MLVVPLPVIVVGVTEVPLIDIVAPVMLRPPVLLPRTEIVGLRVIVTVVPLGGCQLLHVIAAGIDPTPKLPVDLTPSLLPALSVE